MLFAIVLLFNGVIDKPVRQEYIFDQFEINLVAIIR